MGKDVESILKAVNKSKDEVNEKVKSEHPKVAPVKLENSKKSREISYDQIKGSTSFRTREYVPEWTNRDFALYISEKFSERYDEFLDVGLVSSTLYIGHIRKRLLDTIGFCDNATLKSYVDYFFDNYIDATKQRAGGKFYINSMRDKKPVSDFSKIYQYNPSIDKKDLTERIDPSNITEEDLENTYILSNESMLLKYGVVLTINYLISKKSYNKEKACKDVFGAVDRIRKNSGINIVVNKTLYFAPYPDDLDFCDVEWFVEIDKRIDASIFTKGNKKKKLYQFLRESKN